MVEMTGGGKEEDRESYSKLSIDGLYGFCN